MFLQLETPLPEFPTYFEVGESAEAARDPIGLRLKVVSRIVRFLLSPDAKPALDALLDQLRQLATAYDLGTLEEAVLGSEPELATKDASVDREESDAPHAQAPVRESPLCVVSSIPVPLDYTILAADTGVRGLCEALQENPDETLGCLALALAQVAKLCAVHHGHAGEATDIPPDTHLHILYSVRLPRIIPRLLQVHPIAEMRSLKSHAIGRLVRVRGTVIRLSNIRQQVIAMKLVCLGCGQTVDGKFVNFQYAPPLCCTQTPGCKSRAFAPDRESAVTTDWQRVRLQEIQQWDQVADGASSGTAGGIPRTIDCELVHADLLDASVPGDVVDVVGIVRTLGVDADASSRGGSRHHKRALYSIYLEVNSLLSSREQQAPSLPLPSDGPLHDEDERRVAAEADGVPAEAQALRDMVMGREALFERLVHSICPAICGQEMVKAGLLLGLLGATEWPHARHAHAQQGTMDRYSADVDHARWRDAGAPPPTSTTGPIAPAEATESTAPVRATIHVLVVGDPGVGKSQMLRAASCLAPRSVYICGNTTTTSGLTVTVVREHGTGDYALEAGALVLGDRGVCCIDEFDKMGADHQALLEGMEQQSVSVAKAGLVCNLSARTTVLAAANPVSGHYDKAKTVCENLRMSAALLSRFDLVFVVLDRPDASQDRHISEHVMATFGGRTLARGSRQTRLPSWSPAAASSSPLEDVCADTAPDALYARLQRTRDYAREPLPPSLLRQFIRYARRQVHPRLGDEAKHVLRTFYLQLRRSARVHCRAHGKSGDAIPPVTTRQLESLKRLAQARARAQLADVVSARHAQDVVEVVRFSMLGVYSDEHGVVDFTRAGGMSRAAEVHRFVKALHHESARRQNSLFSVDVLKQVAQRIGLVCGGGGGGGGGGDFYEFVDMLNLQGFLLQRGYRQYRLQSSEYAPTPHKRGRC